MESLHSHTIFVDIILLLCRISLCKEQGLVKYCKLQNTCDKDRGAAAAAAARYWCWWHWRSIGCPQARWCPMWDSRSVYNILLSSCASSEVYSAHKNSMTFLCEHLVHAACRAKCMTYNV